MLTYSSVISCPDDLLLKKPVKHKNDNKAEFKKYRSSVSAENLNRRTFYLSDAIPEQIRIWKPDIVVCEDIYYGKDISEMKACARLQGALMYCCNCLGFEIMFTEPSAWRSALGIPLMDKDKKRFHREDFKRIAVNMVEELFGIHVSDDEAEAILLPLAYPYLKIL